MQVVIISNRVLGLVLFWCIGSRVTVTVKRLLLKQIE
jgi:hypothetical protein